MSRSLLPSNATSKIRPQNWRVYTYYNWWHFKRHCTWTSCDPIQALVRDKCLHAQDTHTHTHSSDTLEAWIITRIYWMVVVAPHSIKSFFIGPVINETAMMGECEGRRGLQCSGSNWNHRMSPGAGPGQAATLSDEPPEAVGVEMNGRMLSFSQN